MLDSSGAPNGSDPSVWSIPLHSLVRPQSRPRARFAIPLGIALAVLAAAACGPDRIDVSIGRTDYGRHDLRMAVEAFVVAGRTPAAYAVLARQVRGLGTSMDRDVGNEAERRLIVLAIEPIRSVGDRPIAEQTEALALTVWPTLLGPPIDQHRIEGSSDANILLPQPGESASTYVDRVCRGPFAGECEYDQPAQRGAAIAATAARNALERARNAVDACSTCRSDPGWHELVREWEALERVARQRLSEQNMKTRRK